MGSRTSRNIGDAKTDEEVQNGFAIIAALLGHASDDTTTKHYAHAGAGKSKFPVPIPDPVEVARIRKRYSAPSLEKTDPTPPGW